MGLATCAVQSEWWGHLLHATSFGWYDNISWRISCKCATCVKRHNSREVRCIYGPCSNSQCLLSCNVVALNKGPSLLSPNFPPLYLRSRPSIHHGPPYTFASRQYLNLRSGDGLLLRWEPCSTMGGIYATIFGHDSAKQHASLRVLGTPIPPRRL